VAGFEFDEAQLAAVSFLARYSGRTLEAYRHDLRGFFQWATDTGIAVRSVGHAMMDAPRRQGSMFSAAVAPVLSPILTAIDAVADDGGSADDGSGAGDRAPDDTSAGGAGGAEWHVSLLLPRRPRARSVAHRKIAFRGSIGVRVDARDLTSAAAVRSCALVPAKSSPRAGARVRLRTPTSSSKQEYGSTAPISPIPMSPGESTPTN
jgi:hypothetical protein